MHTSASIPLTFVRNHDGESSTIYKRHEELGRGGFAIVYRITDQTSGQSYALKVIPKDRITKPKALEKLHSEIEIQASLNHPNVLRSFDHFEDEHHYYIITELCPGHSVRDLLKENGHLSEQETIRILRNVLDGLQYLHDNRIIHRDLKLENFLIGSDGKVKIADFGLSAKLDHDDERKFTVCGTPNYLSPELVNATKKGHSYEVDIWAMGVCAYAMLIGRPPFETKHTKLTYEHIKSCKYEFPADIHISNAAKDFIRTTLQIKPELRPSVQELLLHPFVCDTPPTEAPKRIQHTRNDENVQMNIIDCNPPPEVLQSEDASMPKYCVARFCDHSERYGLGYLLIDGTVGACFNDLSRMIMDPFEEFIQYWPNYQTIIPELLRPSDLSEAKKIAILNKFSEALKKTKSMYELPAHRFDQNLPMRHVKYWMRNDEATLFRMDDRNIQVNFNDRVKIVIFWSTKKMMMVHSIKECGRLIGLSDLSSSHAMSEEKRRFGIAKAMLSEMSGR